MVSTLFSDLPKIDPREDIWEGVSAPGVLTRELI